MPITLRHDAAAVALPANSASRKYGQQLVLQGQQQKYQSQQAGYDRLFDAYKQGTQNQFTWNRDLQQNAFQVDRDNRLNEFQKERDKANADRQQQQQDQDRQFAAQQQEAMRQQRFMEEARKQNTGMIMNDIQSGAYDPVTSRKLQQNLVEEAEAMGNPQLDATQRAEALSKIRAERAALTANRMQLPPEQTRDQQLKSFLGSNYEKYKDQPWVPDGKGGFAVAKVPEQKQQPANAQEYYRQDPDKFQKDLDATMGSMQADFETGKRKEAPTPEAAWEEMQKRYQFRQQALGGGQAPAATTPASPAAVAPASPATPSQVPAPNPTAAMPDEGMPPSPERGLPPMPAASTEVVAQRPDEGMPPAPVQSAPMMAQRPDAGSPPVPYSSPADPIPLAANSTSMTPAATNPSRPQQVKVGGKPLVVTPGTLTPQETAARQQIMELPQEDRIMALMPYDPQFKGKTISQILDDPQTKAQYDELTKQGQTTGNYRQDILNHMDETLQHNVLNGAGQSKPDAYVGMNVNDITDPKAKAEVAKIPRPKNADEVKAIRGPYFIDPNGIIRSTQKQA